MSVQGLIFAWMATCTVEGAVLLAFRRPLPSGVFAASLLVNSATNPLANLAVHRLDCRVSDIEAGVLLAEAVLFVLLLGCTTRQALATSLAANAPTALLSLCLYWT